MNQEIWDVVEGSSGETMDVSKGGAPSGKAKGSKEETSTSGPYKRGCTAYKRRRRGGSRVDEDAGTT